MSLDTVSNLFSVFLPGAARYEPKPALYDPRHFHHNVKVTYELTNFGRTSYQQHQQTHSTVTGELLHEDHIFNVLVDLKTRLPTPLTPDFISGLTSAVEVSPRPYPPVVPHVKPDATHQRSYHCHWSHTDYFYHTNQSQYVKFVYDTACDIAMAGELTHFKGDLAALHVDMIEVIYKGETRPNDLLCVHCWEVDASTLAFQVEKATEIGRAHV